MQVFESEQVAEKNEPSNQGIRKSFAAASAAMKTMKVIRRNVPKNAAYGT
ncbi:MAG: hypothetical protein VX641_06435 [Planctomycetota bacterium]|nr:hypothetical protein [Planctomycetota bacterium]